MMTKASLTRPLFHLTAIASVSLLLTACGGGSESAPLPTKELATSVASGAADSGQPVNPAAAAASSAQVSGTSAAGESNAKVSAASTATLASTGAGTASAPPAPGTAVSPFGQNAALYTMTFSDEFSNDLNRSVWNDKIWYEAAPGTKNYAVDNGTLKIWPQRDASGKFFNRTIDTDGKYYQTYGYFEVEAKLPKGKGTWPAFWLFNHIDNRRPEIDVMEAYAGGIAPWGKVVNGVAVPTMYASTVWKDANQQAGMIKIPAPDLSAGFHKYAVKWEPTKQTFYFDGKEVGVVNVTMGDRMYLMLDLWFGSASGQGDNSTPTGKENSYEVNYVRAWKFK